MRRGLTLWVLLAFLIAGCTQAAPKRTAGEAKTLRLGYLANLTHAQALLGVEDGSFERATGVKIEPKVFAAGPAAITALLAGELDALYVGPSPAVNGYIKSGGKALRVVAGAASGGAAFVVRPGVDPNRLEKTRLATPGLGNTQDIALRAYLAGKGLKLREQGGSVQIVPAAPADIITLLSQGQVDGAWVPEPWVARLLQSAGAKLAWDERDLWPDGRFATTVLAVATPYLQQHPEKVRALVRAHVDLTNWIQRDPAEAASRLQAALEKAQQHPLPDALMADALSRIDFVSDPMEQSVQVQAEQAYQLGLLSQKPDLSGLYDLSFLKEAVP